MGKCNNCNEWNTFEKINPSEESTGDDFSVLPNKELREITASVYQTGLQEFDRVLGGGIVEGSLILFSGEPGAGKSTLISQIISSVRLSVFYFSGEETQSQILSRFNRLKISHENVHFFNERFVENIKKYISLHQPKMVVIDSIQTIIADKQLQLGSIVSIKELINEFLFMSKKYNIIFFVIGHATKSGSFAGPKLLEHMVDVYLHLSRNKYSSVRLLTADKNRFGSSEETGFFSMSKIGLIEGGPPGEARVENERGFICAMIFYGSRQTILKLDCIVIKTEERSPKRLGNVISNKKLCMLVAIIENSLSVRLADYDIYLDDKYMCTENVEACDLAYVACILSRLWKINKKLVFIGEVLLNGDISITDLSRVKLHKKLNYCLVGNFKKIDNNIENIIHIKNLSQLKNILSVT